MELNKKRVVEVSWLIDKTYKELEILDYSIESLKKFKYSFTQLSHIDSNKFMN